MKKALTILGFTCLCFSMYHLAVASKATEAEADTSSSIQRILASKTESFTRSLCGVVLETREGFILQTDGGMYVIKGLNLESMKDKLVTVTGLIHTEGETNSIYVVKATVEKS